MARKPAAIIGRDLSGRTCGPDTDGHWYQNIGVGVWCKGEPDHLFPGDALKALWNFEVVLKEDEAGILDFGGPFVAGPRGQRHLGLIWVREVESNWEIFRATKFRLFEMERPLFDDALGPQRRLVGRLGLTDEHGWPRCATVRPPTIDWSVEVGAPDS